MEKRKLILYIACSLDGYISKSGNDLSFLDRVHKEGEDYGYGDFISGIDTVIVGRKTYDWVMAHVEEFPHADKETYVITRTERPGSGRIIFYNKNLNELVNELKKKPGKNIFCDGGAEIIHQLLKEKQIDELIISVIPVLLGDGIKLFKKDRPEQVLELVSVKKFDSGLVQLHYRMEKEQYIN